MKNIESSILLVSSCLVLLTGCIDGKDSEGGDECNPSVIFYSLDREANNVLHQNVLTGNFYALHPDGTPAQQQVLNPVPDKMPLTLGEGNYDLFFIGNLSDAMEQSDAAPGRASSSTIRVKARTDAYFYSADDLHIGYLENYTLRRLTKAETDSIHVKRVVGKVSVRVKDVSVSAQQFRFAMVVSGVARGIDFYRHTLSTPVDIVEYGEIVNNKVGIDAICLPSVAQLKVSAQLIEKSSGNVIASHEKLLDELLTPNKHIIVEYTFDSGNFVEFDIIVKDWDPTEDNSSGEAN